MLRFSTKYGSYYKTVAHFEAKIAVLGLQLHIGQEVICSFPTKIASSYEAVQPQFLQIIL